MKYVETRSIPLSQIEVGQRIRGVAGEWAEGLAESMAAVGQKTPIEVVAQLKGKKYRLIAGAHRYEAALLLGWKDIRAEVKALEKGQDFELTCALHEVDENLHRRDLSPLDRAKHLGRRKEIYEALFPEAKHGGDRGNQHTGGRQKSIVGFCQATAEKTGFSESTIKIYTRIYGAVKDLPPALQARLEHSPLAARAGDLYALSRKNPDLRPGIVEALLTGTHTSVDQAEAALTGKAQQDEPLHERQAKQFRQLWDRSGKKAKRAQLEFLKEIGVITDYELDHVGGPA